MCLLSPFNFVRWKRPGFAKQDLVVSEWLFDYNGHRSVVLDYITSGAVRAENVSVSG